MALWTKASLCVKSSLLEQSLPRTPSRLKTSAISVAKNLCNLWLIFRAFLWLKNPINQRNPRLMNHLHAFDIFTLVENPLQICSLFMQNEPNFRKSQMNISTIITTDYENKTLSGPGKNEPKTNPIKANTNPIKANIMPKQTQYEPNLSRRSLWRSRIKANFKGSKEKNVQNWPPPAKCGDADTR